MKTLFKDGSQTMANSILEQILGASGYGGSASSITKTMGGLDHRRISSPYQKNTDTQGLVLFTRPDMNLSHDNLLSDRRMSPLIRSAGDESVSDPNDIDTLSMNRAIRCLLDPRSASRGIESDLIDNRCAFIPIFTNTCLTLSGWPDPTLDVYTTPPGVRKESIAMVDSVSETNEGFTMTGAFSNVEGDPITSMTDYWNIYSGGTYGDDFVPFPKAVVDNAKDYETRIWRIVLDKSQRYVRKIGSCIAIPLASPISVNMNYNRDNAFAGDNDQLSIPFHCQFAEYNDPILYEEFNITVQMFNKMMSDENRESLMSKLNQNEIRFFNFSGYPRINPLTLELEWWTLKEEYEERIANIYSNPVARSEILEANGYIATVNSNSTGDITPSTSTMFEIETTIPDEPNAADWYQALLDAKRKGSSLQAQAAIAVKLKAAKLKEESA